jgi:hypothetical protein
MPAIQMVTLSLGENIPGFKHQLKMGKIVKESNGTISNLKLLPYI